MMRDYQQQAIEFAALHDRVMRGTAPADFHAAGSPHGPAAGRAAGEPHAALHAAPSMPRHRQDWA